MPASRSSFRLHRRTFLTAGLAVGASRVASPFVIRARAADVVKIGLDNPLTGTLAGNGKNELIGCQLAVEQINAKGGILGREVELIAEDSTSGDAGTAVLKARKLIDGDKVDFLLGNTNSALSLAIAQVSYEKKILHVVPGGHTDAVTGGSCHWNVFRVCNTTQMEALAITGTLIKNYGKKFYYITLDYAFGHTLEAAMVKASTDLGGSRVGGALTPLGTVDFSSYLIGAEAANPDVIIFLLGGDDMVNALKQAVQFGLDKKLHLAGAQQELEPLEGLPPEARIGIWVMEWYWKQPGVPHVANSSTSSGNAPAACLPRGPGSDSSRSGLARWRRPRPSPSMRWRWPRPSRDSSCRRKSASRRTRPSTARTRTSSSAPSMSATHNRAAMNRRTCSR